ncbi:hypothetical protein [Thomasclavelia cocleata]|uniref:hypothetical protein n=1 Tax=Thomasclavelia cocleata TaxID=69824 RepID=UPI002430ACEE|nr:hypothetical protein [Thomasclavelia cocleata]MCI9630655.1 hypothetical protein [Thomasclavelia cocleata]
MNNETDIIINKVFKYIITSFILSFFIIEVGWIPYISITLSGLFFYAGIRLIKDINDGLKYSYYFAYLFLIINMFNVILCAMPFYSDYFNGLVIFIGIVRIFLMVFGFRKLLNNNRYVRRFILCYLLELLTILIAYVMDLRLSLFTILIAVICFILKIRQLIMIKKDILKINNLKFANIKISTLKLGLLYFFITIILCLVITFVSAAMYHQYDSDSKNIIFDSENALDYKSFISYNENKEELAKVEVYLFKEDDQYRNYIVINDIKDEIYYQELSISNTVYSTQISDFTYKIAYQNPLNNKVYKSNQMLKSNNEYFKINEYDTYGTYFGNRNKKKSIISTKCTVDTKINEGCIYEIYVKMDNDIIPSYPFNNNKFENKSEFLIRVTDDKIEIVS